MVVLQVGAFESFLLFVVVPGTALAVAIALSVYEIYRIGERKLLIVIVILGLMLQHQVLEAITFLQTNEAVNEGFGEVFETGANVVASASVYYVLRFARRERRLVEELERSEREYEQIFNSVEDAIIIYDPDTLDVVTANEAYLDLFGYESDDAIRAQGVSGMSVTEEGYTEQRAREAVQRAVESGDPEVIEWQAETKEGERIWLEIKVAPGVIGGEQRAICINRDITERKRREQRLEVFNRILRHNLRNRVDVIKSHAAELADRTDGDDATRISTAADRLAAIGERARKIDQFMSRERNETTVNLSERIGRVLDSVGHSDRHVTITRDLPNRSTLVTDGEVIDVVLESALDNAIQYAESSVEVTVEPVPDGYEISITDDGPGIPSEELSPLDAGTETDLQHGRGLGLWQLKWGVQKLNGRLSFDVSRGTTVQITIPDVRADGRHQ